MKTNRYKVTVNGIPYEVEIEPLKGKSQISLNAKTVNTASNSVALTQTQQVQSQVVQLQAAQQQAIQQQAVQAQGSVVSNVSGEGVFSPMQGKIVSVAVSTGQVVKSGQVLAVLEAMKMENEIMAARDAKVVDVHVKSGQSVEANDILVTLV